MQDPKIELAAVRDDLDAAKRRVAKLEAERKHLLEVLLTVQRTINQHIEV